MTAEGFVIRLEIDLGPWESDYDLLASFGLFAGEYVERPTTLYRPALERRLLGVVHEELGEVEVQIQYSRGSLTAWIIASAGQGAVGGLTWAVITHVGQRLADAALGWTRDDLGQQTHVVFQVFGAPPPDMDESPRSQLLILNPTFLLGIYALFAQAALIFVLVWLLVHSYT
jgi:hypothetical protein